MEIFGIGPLELLLIFVLALIFIGPGKMPEVAASLGKMLREFRAASAELTDALNAEIAEAERRKTAVAVGENGNGHSQVDAVAQAEIVAQGALDAPAPVEFTSPEVINYQYEPPTAPPPAPIATIDDVLGAIALQEAEEAAKREAEERARLEAIALERAIQKGVGPLPESLLRPSTDSPLVVVNPTAASAPPEPVVAEAVESSSAPDVATEVTEVPAAPDVVTEGVEATAVTMDAAPAAESVDVETPAPASNGELHDVARAHEPEVSDGKPAEAEGEPLEAAGARQAEVQ